MQSMIPIAIAKMRKHQRQQDPSLIQVRVSLLFFAILSLVLFSLFCL